MYCVKKVKEDMYWVGGSDRRLALFENVYPIPEGISYNAYLVMDEKTVLIDAVDKSIEGLFFENVEHVLNGRPLDYLIVNHMEPDHGAAIGNLFKHYPDLKVVTNSKSINMIKQFFTFDIDAHCIVVKEGDILQTGRHSFSFVMAPMVHWPETMVTYDGTDKVLYSGDAFGTFGAINGNLFADEIDFQATRLDDARRYYSNIVGKYGPQVQALIKKAKEFEISLLCPLHGPVWRENIDWYIGKYDQWSTYTPEDKAVMIVFGSIYGNTENAADILASALAQNGIKNIAMYDVSSTHMSYIVSEAFRCSHIVLASSTYNGEIFVNMQTLLLDFKAHNLQKRKIAIMENGTWMASSGRLMTEIVSSMKDMEIIGSTLSIKSSLKEDQLECLGALADEIAKSLSVYKR